MDNSFHVVFHWEREFGWHAVCPALGFFHTDGVWRHTQDSGIWWNGPGNVYRRLYNAVNASLKQRNAA